MPAICLITALPSEARPLIEHFRLGALRHKHLRLYQGTLTWPCSNQASVKPTRTKQTNANQISKIQKSATSKEVTLYLLQCGVGKLNAAANTGAMLEFLPSVNAVINLGIAGSDRPLGQTLIAHCLQEKASSQQWYPHLPSPKHIDNTVSVKVQTVDTPAYNYTDDIAFDMEASGIVTAAAKVLDLAFIHSIKVVSDNHDSAIERITSKSIGTQLANCIPVLNNLMAALPFDTLPSLADAEELSRAIQSRIHFSITEQHGLSQLLLRHKALLGELPGETRLLKLATAKSIRQHLTGKLELASISY